GTRRDVALERGGRREKNVQREQSAERMADERSVLEIGCVARGEKGLELGIDEAEEVVGAAKRRVVRPRHAESLLGKGPHSVKIRLVMNRREIGGSPRGALQRKRQRSGRRVQLVADADDKHGRQLPG